MSQPPSGKGRWPALLAAILGWMFDGFEMGLFPLVARPALFNLLGTTDDAVIGTWMGIIYAGFLVGAATGGVLFGWLGDRIGRVRAMALSILTYALFSGLCGFAHSATVLFALRLIASLGMGGEWALGVSLVMEIWPSRSRGWLAGLIGAAANVGFVSVALVGLALGQIGGLLETLLHNLNISAETIAWLMDGGGWRILMMTGALPALLTFLIRLFVPESEAWLEEHSKGATSHWATRDLLGVLAGSLGPIGMIVVFAIPSLTGSPQGDWALRIATTVVGLIVAIAGYTYPVRRYLERAAQQGPITGARGLSVLKLMMLGAALSGIALIGTWASVQMAPSFADKLAGPDKPYAKAYTQIVLGLGAILGTIAAAVIGHKFGRRITYAGMCLLSLASIWIFFRGNSTYGPGLLFWAFVMGTLTASFYGWLPLYLPELFPARVRATGQGFSFYFGRILAAVASLQTGALISGLFQGSYSKACSVMGCVYLIGVVVIWLAPETHGEELPT